jgi:O-antigen/teichoic acid export membrane protein
MKASLPGWLDLVYNPETGVGYVFISNLISSLFTLLLLSGTIAKMKFRFQVRLWSRILAYSLPLLVAGLAGTVNEALDRILLRHLLPDPATALDQVGIYGANYKIAVLMTLFVQMFRYAGEPFYFGQAGSKNAKKLFAEVMKYFIIAALGIFLIIILYLDLFKHFIGKNFHEGLHIVPIVLCANILLGIFFNLSIWYKLNNLTRYGAMITIIGAGITFIINWTLIPVIGYMASAWAHLACYGSMVLVSWVLGRKHYRIHYPLKRIGLYALMTAIIFMIAGYTGRTELITRLIINTGLLTGFVIIVVFKERRDFKNLNESNRDIGGFGHTGQ